MFSPKENCHLRACPLLRVLGPCDACTHKKKGPPEAGLSNYRLSTGGGLRRRVPWLVGKV